MAVQQVSVYKLLETIDLSTVLWVILILFIGSGIVVFTIVLYSDCPYSSTLDLKLLWFGVLVIHICAAACVSTELGIFELAGILSWRLLAHYVNRESAVRSSSIAICYSKLTDIVLAIIIIGSAIELGSIDSLARDLLLLAGTVKSLHIFCWLWLPDAMEGPSQVSALLHSATLVILGILVFIHHESELSAIISALSYLHIPLCILACFIDSDLKRAAAISTINGILIAWLCLSISPGALLTCLFLHAAYKAVIFACLTGYQQESRIARTWAVIILVACLALLVSPLTPAKLLISEGTTISAIVITYSYIVLRLSARLGILPESRSALTSIQAAVVSPVLSAAVVSALESALESAHDAAPALIIAGSRIIAAVRIAVIRILARGWTRSIYISLESDYVQITGYPWPALTSFSGAHEFMCIKYLVNIMLYSSYV